MCLLSHECEMFVNISTISLRILKVHLCNVLLSPNIKRMQFVRGKFNISQLQESDRLKFSCICKAITRAVETFSRIHN
jgi:hypothetical protein